MDIQYSRAAHTLLTHLNRIPSDRPDHAIGARQLADAVFDPGTPDDLFAAASYFVTPNGAFQSLDTAAGIYPADGQAGRLDLIAAASEGLTGEQALEIIAQHTAELDTAAGLGERDGRFGREDLEAVVHNPDAPLELAEAAQYYLAHESTFQSLGNSAGQGPKNDGYVGLADLNFALAGQYYRQSGLSPY